MSSPILILEEKYYLCVDIKNKIQTFLKNDVTYDALRQYFIYLSKKKDLYQKFCEYQYNIETDLIDEDKNDKTYIPEDYLLCIIENPQEKKIGEGDLRDFQYDVDLYNIWLNGDLMCKSYCWGFSSFYCKDKFCICNGKRIYKRLYEWDEPHYNYKKELEYYHDNIGHLSNYCFSAYCDCRFSLKNAWGNENRLDYDYRSSSPPIQIDKE